MGCHRITLFVVVYDDGLGVVGVVGAGEEVEEGVGAGG